MSVTVAKLPAGCGKTTTYARHVAACKDVYPAEIYAPTLDMAWHWKQLIEQYNSNCRVEMVIGRTAEFDDGSTLCQRRTEAEQLSQAGLSVYSRLCRASDGSGDCPHYQACPYIQQFDLSIDVFIYTHAHLFLDRGRLEQRKPRLVIIDESFVAMGVEEVIVDSMAVNAASWLPIDARQFVADVVRALQQDAPLVDIRRSYRRLQGGIAGLIKRLDGLLPAITPTTHVANALSQVNVGLIGRVKKLFRHVLLATRYQDSPQSITLKSDTLQVVCQILKPITRFKVGKYEAPPDIVVLDASASRTLIERFLPVSTFKTMAADRNSYVIQCRSTVSSTRSLLQMPTGAGVQSGVPTRVQELQVLIDKVAADQTKLLVVGPSAVVGNANKGVGGLMRVPAHCDTAHFNALRGEDKWSKFDAVLVIGRNEPSVPAMESMATALFMADPRPLQLLSGAYLPSVPRGYRMADGSKAGVDVAVHPDMRVQEVIELHRECETLQAVDRLRLVHSNARKLVLLSSNLPLDIDVDELRSWNEFIHGSRLEQALAASGGTLPLASAWLADNFPQHWSTLAAAKKDIQRELKKGLFSTSYINRKMSPLKYQYRLPGQKRWSHCLSHLRTVKKVQTALRRLLGKGVEVKP